MESGAYDANSKLILINYTHRKSITANAARNFRTLEEYVKRQRQQKKLISTHKM